MLAVVGEGVGAAVDGQLVGATDGSVLDAVSARRVATLARDVEAPALGRVRPEAEVALVAARPWARVLVAGGCHSCLLAPCGRPPNISCSI